MSEDLEYRPTFYMPEVTMRIREYSADVTINGNGCGAHYSIILEKNPAKKCDTIHFYDKNHPLAGGNVYRFVPTYKQIHQIYRPRVKYGNKGNKSHILFAIDFLLRKLAKERKL